MANRDRRDTQNIARREGGGGPLSRRDPFSSAGLDPFSQFRRLSDQMDRWFESFGLGRPSHFEGLGEGPWGGMWAPETETFMRGDQFVVRMDLPGLKKDDVSVEVTDEAVIIHGERQKAQDEEREGYYRSERSYGRFYREIPLPEGAQGDTAEATYRDGVLEVSVKAPGQQGKRARRIEIGGAPSGERGTIEARAESSTRETERGGRGQRSVAADRGTGSE